MTPLPDSVPGINDALARTRARSPGPQILEAMFSYFVVALMTGWLLAPIRNFFIGAGADPLLAVLSEATATLLILIWAAGWAVQAFGVPPQIAPRLTVGVGAMTLLLTGDLFMGFLTLGLPPLALARRFANSAGMVVGLSLALGALLPVLRVRRMP
ncbi:MAG TPA: hypothetical protein VFE10_01345 [Phenylobacterium sp.]|jgi:hypothetical protein|nr:hypothetical protein [Phenylobacterium sp.]